MTDVKRGWSSAGLRTISPSDPRYWSIAEAARLLGPPQLDEAAVRQLVKLAGIEPRGKRQNGPKRRHVRVYDAVEFIAAFEKLAEVTEK